MKKMIIAFLAVTLVFSLIGCDAMLNVMEKMSNNVAGTEKKVIEDSLNAAKPVPSEKKDPEDVKNEDGTTTTTTTFTQSSGEESKPLFSIVEKKEEVVDSSTLETITKTTETKISFDVGKTKIEIPVEKSESLEKLAKVEAVLTPTDLTDVILGLKSGSKSEIEAELKKLADEDSKKAAEGTQTVIKVLVESFIDPSSMTPENENEEKVLETVNMILGNTSSEEEPKEMTQADVVVLTALNNVIFNNVEGVVGSLATISNDEADKDKKDEASKQLMETVLNEATTLVDIVSVVPSDMASGIKDVLGLFMTSSGK